MRTIHFQTPGDFRNEEWNYLAIQGEQDTDFKIPVYKKQLDGRYHRVERLWFPSCTKFMHSIDIKLDEDLTVDQIEQQFGDISALP